MSQSPAAPIRTSHQPPGFSEFRRNEQRAFQRVPRLQGGPPIEVASAQVDVSLGRPPTRGMLCFLPLGLECRSGLLEAIQRAVLLGVGTPDPVIHCDRIQ
jgi:hypothetical protein